MGLLLRIVFFVHSLVWAAPPTLLSQTGLYQDIKTKKVDPTHLYFEPQYPLWTDGAHKARWVSIPPGKQIQNGGEDATEGDADHWLFPVGTRVWKEFSFPDPQNPQRLKRVETRYYRKSRENGWFAASFLWNENETEATVAPEEGIKNYFPLAGGKSHSIPGVMQCFECHQRGGDPVLGLDALQLSTDRDPLALHVQQNMPPTITLRTLIERNLLSHPGDLLSEPPRIHSHTDVGRAAMGYLHGNCGHCHHPEGSAAATGQFLRFTVKAQSEEVEPAFKTTVNIATKKFKIPGESETFRILPKNPEISAVPYRLHEGTMPPLGTKIVDEEAVEQISSWIRTLKED